MTDSTTMTPSKAFDTRRRSIKVPRGYSISKEFEVSSPNENSSVLRDDGTVDSSIGKNESTDSSSSSIRSVMSNIFKKSTMGGSVFDGFLLAASQEVGQVILTLPHVFSLLGFTAGIVLELGFATLALHTNYLLVSMHAEHRRRLAETNSPKHNDPYHIVSYHEIMENLVGKWLSNLSIGVVFFALLGLSTVQIIATASNFYILDDSISKRTWALIWGGIFSLIAFVPTFRHYRFLSIIGILTTTYTAWFMTITSAIEGPIDDVVYDAPSSVEGFFTGLVQLLFVYGGHTSNVEVADVMDNPASYDKSYFWSYIYVFTLTMPNAVATYHTYGMEARYNANSFNLFPRSYARDFGIVMMSLHQAVAFGLFAGPLFHMWEKLIRIHNKPFATRAIARLPLCASMLFLAVAFPFFGAINGVLGALTTTFGTYIIPCVGYNLAFSSKTSQENMVKKPVIPIKYVRMFNWIVAVFVFVAGVGAGGYTSIKNFIQQIEYFDYFAECYQC